MPIIDSKPPGVVPPRVDKRAAETITYLINCKELLDKHELVVSAAIPNLPSGIEISGIRTRKGTSIEIKVTNAPIISAAYIDYNINMLFNTTFNNTRAAAFIVRVYK
jgi:hypothetical protein